MRYLTLFLFLLVLISVSLLTLYPVFKLGLFGDDWLSFWKYMENLGLGSENRHWNYLSYYLTSYGPQDITMGLLRNIFGFQSYLYQIAAYFFRLIAALSLYPLVFYLTKNNLAAFFSILFFSITAIGFDTTNWVFNMPSYIGIAFFNLFLFMFLKSRDEKGYKSLLLAGLFYYLGYVTAPIRFTGLLPFVIVIELFWLLLNRNKETTKRVAVRIVFIFLIFVFIGKTGDSHGVPSDWRDRFIGGITTSINYLSQGRFDFLFYPLVTFGGMFVPDLLLPEGKQFVHKADLLFSLLPFYLLFIIVLVTVTKDLPKKGISFLWKNAIAGILWLFVVMLIFIGNRLTFSNGRFIFQLLMGGYALILSTYIGIKSFDKPPLINAIFVSIAWSILAFFFAWWWAPNTIFPITYRYLIGSASGIAIFLGILFSLGKNTKTKYFFTGLFLVLLLLQMKATRMYIHQQLDTHGSDISEKIWSAIPYVPNIVKDPGPKIFYFEGDGTNAGIMHDSITFGFPPHMALIYNMREEDGLFPTPMEDFNEVMSAAIDGKPFHRYNYFKPLPLDRIFAFRLEGKDNLVNITSLAHQRLQQVTATLSSSLKP